MRLGTMVAMVGCVALSGVAIAAPVTPRLIPYRGYLEKDGAPVTGTVDMQFSLWIDPTSTNTSLRVWSENQYGVSVVQGNFNVALGSMTTITLAMLQKPQLYLEITVAGSTLQGRQQILTVPYARYSEGAVPVGTIVAFGGGTPPAGWMICDGSPLNSSAYPELYTAIGTRFGGNATNFNLPNFQGQFLRGSQAGRAVGSSESWSTAMPRNKLAVGWNSSLNHAHGYGDIYYADARNSGSCWLRDTTQASAAFGSNSSAWTANLNNIWCETQRNTATTDLSHSHTISGGDAETRPNNIAVNWIIKVTE